MTAEPPWRFYNETLGSRNHRDFPDITSAFEARVWPVDRFAKLLRSIGIPFQILANDAPFGSVDFVETPPPSEFKAGTRVRGKSRDPLQDLFDILGSTQINWNEKPIVATGSFVRLANFQPVTFLNVDVKPFEASVRAGLKARKISGVEIDLGYGRIFVPQTGKTTVEEFFNKFPESHFDGDLAVRALQQIGDPFVVVELGDDQFSNETQQVDILVPSRGAIPEIMRVIVDQPRDELIPTPEVLIPGRLSRLEEVDRFHRMREDEKIDAELQNAFSGWWSMTNYSPTQRVAMELAERTERLERPLASLSMPSKLQQLELAAHRPGFQLWTRDTGALNIWFADELGVSFSDVASRSDVGSNDVGTFFTATGRDALQIATKLGPYLESPPSMNLGNALL